MERYDYEKKKPAITRQKANISVPVTVKPKVCTEGIVSYCCGSPVLKQKSNPYDSCHKSECKFMLTQNICIEIPIEFEADTIVGEACIDCDCT